MNKPRVVCITGPTATGKSEAAIAVCKALPGEVLSMDSMQIYHGFDIGTAKCARAETQGIAHHLLSYVSPLAPYSVAEYQADARSCMRSVLARGKLPVFTGGTGLYLQAISRPLRFSQTAGDPKIRSRLEWEASEPMGKDTLYSRLSEADPKAAAKLHPNNTRRVIRALEVYETTGIPMSEQAGEWNAKAEENWQIYALILPRNTLYRRIEQRVDTMIRAGLVEEVDRLLAGGVPITSQAMQGIGYKEIVAYLRHTATLDEAIAAIKQNTRRYAKRQITWLKRDERVQWIDLAEYSTRERAHSHLIEQIKKHGGHAS